MERVDPEKLNELVSLANGLIGDLVLQAYETVARRGRAGGLDARQIEDAISEYGGRLTLPPADALSSMNIIPVQGSNPPRWQIVYDFWVDHALSDLTMLLTVCDDGHGHLNFILEDIHVL